MKKHECGKPEPYIRSGDIMRFVRAVEAKKKYVRRPDFVMRHTVEEVGELSAALFSYERLTGREEKSVKDLFRYKAGREIVDVISCCLLLADVIGVDVNQELPRRLEEVAKQYDVDWKKYGL